MKNILRYLSSLAIISPLFIGPQILLAQNGNGDNGENGALFTGIYFNDFEEESLGDNTSTDPSGIRGLRPAFPGAEVKGDETATPFGEVNQFIEFSGANSRVPVHVSAVAPAVYLEPVVVAFDLYEPEGFAGRTVMGVGSGQYVPELNFNTEIFSIEINNGFLTAGGNTSNIFGSLPILEQEKAYRVFMLMNMSEAVVNFNDPGDFESDLGSREMEVWIYDYDEDEYLFGGRWGTNQENIQDTIGFVFRHFSIDTNVIYVDNLLVADSFAWTVREWERDEDPVDPVDPVDPTHWAGYEIDEDGWVDTGSWLGPVYVVHQPWVYSMELVKWLFIPEAGVDANGGWTYILAH